MLDSQFLDLARPPSCPKKNKKNKLFIFGLVGVCVCVCVIHT